MRHRYFSSQHSSTWIPLSLINDSLKIQSRNKFGTYTRNHLRAATSTSSVLWNRRPPHYCTSNPQSFHPLELRSHPSFMCWADWYDHHECPIHHTVTLSIVFWQVVLSWCTLNIHLCQMAGNFNGENMFLPQKPKHAANFFAVPCFRCRCHCSIYHITDIRMADSCATCCVLNPIEVIIGLINCRTQLSGG